MDYLFDYMYMRVRVHVCSVVKRRHAKLQLIFFRFFFSQANIWRNQRQYECEIASKSSVCQVAPKIVHAWCTCLAEVWITYRRRVAENVLNRMCVRCNQTDGSRPLVVSFVDVSVEQRMVEEPADDLFSIDVLNSVTSFKFTTFTVIMWRQQVT